MIDVQLGASLAGKLSSDPQSTASPTDTRGLSNEAILSGENDVIIVRSPVVPFAFHPDINFGIGCSPVFVQAQDLGQGRRRGGSAGDDAHFFTGSLLQHKDKTTRSENIILIA
jgi:hypothetical protein